MHRLQASTLFRRGRTAGPSNQVIRASIMDGLYRGRQRAEQDEIFTCDPTPYGDPSGRVWGWSTVGDAMKARVSNGPEVRPTLAEVGIDKHLADRARKMR